MHTLHCCECTFGWLELLAEWERHHRTRHTGDGRKTSAINAVSRSQTDECGKGWMNHTRKMEREKGGGGKQLGERESEESRAKDRKNRNNTIKGERWAGGDQELPDEIWERNVNPLSSSVVTFPRLGDGLRVLASLCACTLYLCVI